ncbi:MAG: hypothetical protein ACRDQZ_09725 [Mycobacteriales bacterium]
MRPYDASIRELETIWMSSLALHGQDPTSMHDALSCRAMPDRFHERPTEFWFRKQLEIHKRIWQTLSHLSSDDVEILGLVYKPSGQVNSKLREALEHLAMLAPHSPAARAAYAQRYKRQPECAGAVARFLEDEAGNANGSIKLMHAIRSECDKVRLRALAAYDKQRRARWDESAEVERARAAVA